MEKKFSISQTAKMVDMTSEALRHYDRIGLVKPYIVDEWTGYRYYSEQEIVRLNTIKALRYMDLTLEEIKKVLDYNDLNQIITLLKQAEKNASLKMEEMRKALKKINRARVFYENKRNGTIENKDSFIQEFPQRAILLSNTLKTPTIDNLWDYHRHFYKQIGEKEKEYFSFEDLAGIYEENGKTQLFAECNTYKNIENLILLPKGKYLCANCSEANQQQVLQDLLKIAYEQYQITPKFKIFLIVLSGILQWNYQIQIYLEQN